MFKQVSHLFASAARIKLLKFFVLQSHIKVPLEEVASVVGVSRSTATVELNALLRMGILISKKQGKKKLYFLSSTYPYLDALRVFLEEISWPDEKTISEAFRGVPGITLLVVTGVLVRDTRPSLDVLVVTRRPKDTRIRSAVKKLEARAGFPLRYAVIEAGDYSARRDAHDRLLRDVFEYSHQVIIGRP